MPIITLLSDFGLRDPYVGVMKGVILGLCPDCQLVDLTHEVEPQDVRQGAFQLARAARWFPGGTIHLAVVDPGVGGQRRPLVLQTEGGFFVGPDNGLFELALRHDPLRQVYRIPVPDNASATFHGRDVFAPAAARLACGLPVGEPDGNPLLRLEWSALQIVHLDRFGNAISGYDGPDPLGVLVSGQRIPFVTTYSAVAAGEPLCLRGSDGHLEIAVNRGSAATRLGLETGQPIELY